MLRVFCPSCKTPFDVDQGLLGQKGLCPTCGAKFIISSQGGPQTAPEASTTQPIASPVPVITNDEPASSPSGASRMGLLGTLVVAAIVGGGYWAVSNGKIPSSKWLTFSGELHPMLVHFPAALIPALALLQLLGGKSAQDGAGLRMTRILLWLNFLACGAAIFAGHVSGLDRGEGEDLRLHTRLGLVVTVLSFLSLAFHQLKIIPAFRLHLFMGLAAVLAAGHFGANMSHGDLLKKAPWTVPSVPAASSGTGSSSSSSGSPTAIENGASTAAGTFLATAVQPILNGRCVSCHGAEKAKGDLRLDSYQAMLLAGESGKPSFIPRNVPESESLVRITLPLEEDDHMPPAKKPQISPDELAVLKWWVEQGADANLKADDAAIPAEIQKQVQSTLAALAAAAAAPPVAP